MHRDEVARAEQRYRIEALEVRAAEEYGVDLPTLLAEYGPAAPVPPTPQQVAAAEAAGEPSPTRCPTTAPSRSAARRRPSATSPPSARSTRWRWRSSRRWRSGTASSPPSSRTSSPPGATCSPSSARSTSASTRSSPPPSPTSQREFEQVFATLFPGGHGRLVLTEPDDLLATGIEVEARPPGKKVKRLSLLSGGERSLTAVALLVAIFRARPSPFYVLDEVEAALDDVNLGRLLTLVEQLRSTSQLIIITHQKRTMEIADALYGVSMRGDGITGVISQRLRELETA